MNEVKERERQLHELPVKDITVVMDRDPGDIGNLVSSIKELGLLEPVIVRQLVPGTYQLVAGRRRFAAAQKLEMVTIPAEVLVDVSDEEALAIAIAENTQRKQMSPVEISKRVMEDLTATGVEPITLTKSVEIGQPVLDQLTAKYNADEDTIVRLINLSLCDESIKLMAHTGKMTLGAAVMTLGFSDKDVKALLKHLAKFKGVVYPTTMNDIISQGLGVNDLSDLAGRENIPTDCTECQFRGRRDPALFEDVGVEDGYNERYHCHNTVCYQEHVRTLRAAVDGFAEGSGLPKGLNVTHSTNYYNVTWGNAERKDPDACKGCKTAHILVGKRGLEVQCSTERCPKKNIKAKTKQTEMEGRTAGGQQEKKAPTPERELIEAKCRLQLRKCAMARAAEHIGSSEVTADQVVAFIMLRDNPMRWRGLRLSEGRSDSICLLMSRDAMQAVSEIGVELLKNKEELVAEFKRRVDYSNITVESIDYQMQLLTGAKDFAQEIYLSGDLAGCLMGKSKERLAALVEKGWAPSWIPKDKRPAPVKAAEKKGAAAEAKPAKKPKPAKAKAAAKPVRDHKAKTDPPDGGDEGD